MQGLMMDYPLTVDRILEHANSIYPNKQITTKLAGGSTHRYSFATLYKRVKRLANVLDKLGIQAGDRVGTFSWNNYQHLELYYAVPCCGAICHTLNIRLSPDQLAYIINHAEDKIIFIDATLLPVFEQAADKIRCVKHYVLFNASNGTETMLPDFSFYEQLMADSHDDYDWPVKDENTAMGLCYTSGTTGNPKGVLYSHRSMYIHTLGTLQGNALGLREQDVVLPVVPMFHAMAWGLPYSCVFAGADMVLPGSHQNSAALAEMIQDEKVTVPAGVATIWRGLYHELKTKSVDVSTVRDLVSGGTPIPRALIEAYEKELGVNVLHTWGMTEMSPLGTFSRLQSHHHGLHENEKWDVKAKQGQAMAGVEMRILNEAGEELPRDGISMGELQVRGPWVAKSYFKLTPTEEYFTRDGWFRTGDVASIDEDGFMNITDRTKDLVKSGGEWISSVSLENALMAHPKVLEAAVIAIPDEKWTERPLAVVVLQPDAGQVSAEKLRIYLTTKFEKFWLPERFIFIKEIPKTSVGKFDKKALRRRYKEGLLI